MFSAPVHILHTLKTLQRLQAHATRRYKPRCMDGVELRVRTVTCNAPKKTVIVPVRAYLGNITHYTLPKLKVFRLRRPHLISL